MRADGRTAVTMVIVTFSGLTNGPIKGSNEDLYLKTMFVYYYVMEGDLLPLRYKCESSVIFCRRA